MSNNNNKKSEQPNPFGSYPYSLTNPRPLLPLPQTQKQIDGLKKYLNAEIGFIFFKEKFKLERTDGGDAAVAKIDEYTKRLREQYIKNWDQNVKGNKDFMDKNGRLDKNKILGAITGSTVGLLHPSNKKGGRRTRRKTRKRRKFKKPLIPKKMWGVFTRKAKKKKMSVQKYAKYIIKKFKGKKKTKKQLKLLRQAVFAKTAKKWKKRKGKRRRRR